MIPDRLEEAIRENLSGHFLGKPGKIAISTVGGGSINQAYRLSFQGGELFCKINSASKFPHLFAKEAGGLKLLQEQNVIRTPEVLDFFEAHGSQVFLLEWIDQGEKTEAFWKKFGKGLAQLHQVSAHRFGWTEDNYMGTVPQSNAYSGSWINFFIEQRLSPLVRAAMDKNYMVAVDVKQFENLYRQLPGIFSEEQKPALVHGDLWSGNFICSRNSEPVLIDPAVYYGHPSVDLGMTTLFGGFRSPFYEAYHYYTPFPSNYQEQWEVCNLYPLLIHLLLFGKAYLSQITQTLFRYQ